MTIFAPSAVPAQPCHPAEAAGHTLHAQLLASARRDVAAVASIADPVLALATLLLGDAADDIVFANLADALDAA